jgi:hypothetical protein
MINFIVGTIFGIIVATIGFSGVAALADQGVEATKEIVQDAAKK